MPTFDELYSLGPLLGSGSFSRVHLCTEKVTNKEWAVKIVEKETKIDEEDRMAIIMTEINILRVIDHPNVVKLKDIFETEKAFFIVMEIINGGELFDRIVELKNYTEKEASKIIVQILSAVGHLHSKNIVHRDLKPENLLLSSKEHNSAIKVTDFGLSQIFVKGEPMEMDKAVGTPGYLAPEVLGMLDTGEPYGKEIDLWSIGVILYILLCGFPPFFGDSDDDVYDKIVSNDWKFISPYWDSVSDSAKSLIRGLMTPDPRSRFSVQQALAHPWIANFENNNGVHLDEAIVQLKKFNARRKFKGVVHAVTALGKFKKMF